MGRRREKEEGSCTLPPPPSSSSSDFEFSISISPGKSSTLLCPADELFYKGQLLPLHPSPRISMLLSSSSSTSSTSSAPRDSSSSHSSIASDPALIPDSDSSRPSSVTLDDDFNQLHQKKPNTKYFSFSRFSSVFRKDNHKSRHPESVSSASSVKRMSNTAKDVIKKYAKPLYYKLWQKQQQQQQQQQPRRTVSSLFTKTERSAKEAEVRETESVISHSFSGNLLRYPSRRRSCVSSCPSSMRSSPTHSGVLSRGGFAGGMCYGDSSTMEELQSAIQGAIAHCKNSLVQNKTMVSDEI